MVIYTARKEVIKLKSNPLGKGGQGKVYKVTNKPMLVAKLFHSQHCTKELEQKIKLMVAKPPLNKQSQHTYFAWPTEVAYDNSGKFIGYLMPELVNMKSIYSVSHPKLKPKGFSWHYSITTASNLARIVEILHKHGCIIGDLNESNIMVSSGALVSVLDCDSMQIKDVNGNTIYHSQVKIDDYLPPELQDIDLKNHTRYEYHDNFSLAVLIFQLLMNGTNPYFGSGARTPKENIKNNYTFVIDKNIKPPAGTPPLHILPDDILNIFKACFANGFHNPSSRPSPKEWIKILQNLEANIVKCPQNHSYSNHLSNCPWCEREQTKTKVSQRKPQQVQQVYTPHQSSTPPASTPIHTPTQTNKPNPIALLFDKYEHLDSVVAFTATVLVCGGITSISGMAIGWDSSHVWHITFPWGAGIAAFTFLIISAITSSFLYSTKSSVLTWSIIGTILITTFLPWIIAGIVFILIIAFIIMFLIGMISG